jgi:hypothetical protein
MKKLNKKIGIVFIGLILCFLLQSCASRNNQYGCPERIEAFVPLFHLP